MNTMSRQLQIDDLLDARAEVRVLRKELLQRQEAFRAVRHRLMTATNRVEGLLTELEQQQGRLPFAEAEEAEAPAPVARPSNRRKSRQAAAAGSTESPRAGQSSWKE